MNFNIHCCLIQKHLDPFLYENLETVKQKKVENHIQLCKSCQQKVAENKELQHLLTSTLELVETPISLHLNIMDAIRQQSVKKQPQKDISCFDLILRTLSLSLICIFFSLMGILIFLPVAFSHLQSRLISITHWIQELTKAFIKIPETFFPMKIWEIWNHPVLLLVLLVGLFWLTLLATSGYELQKTHKQQKWKGKEINA